MVILKKKKTSKGRQKIEIKKIENLSSRQVTFSKRRLGLFKKASELCILSGAEIAILVRSLTHRIFSFGHPTADAVVDRFLCGGSEGCPAAAVVVPTRDYNKEYYDVCKELDEEKKRVVEYGGGGREWWNDGGDGKTVEDLEQYATALDELRMNINTRANELTLVRNSKFLMPVVRNPYVEAAPPASAVGCSVVDTTAFVNQGFHDQHVWWC